MNRNDLFNLICVGAVLGLVSLVAHAQQAAPIEGQQGGVKAGILTCHEASGWGFIFGSTRDLRCVYSPKPGLDMHYDGHISQYGVDIGYRGAATMVWAVFAPSLTLAPEALNGDYVGATGSAAVGIGGGANVLVGGSNKSISLQPVSFVGETGLNIAAGVAAVSLKYHP